MNFITISRNYTEPIQWTSLDPQKLLNQLSRNATNLFPFDRFERYMKKAGISTGYLEKPCLNVNDPQCPVSAPNKRSKQVIYSRLFVGGLAKLILFLILDRSPTSERH
jgi:hypothetical protein